ncbi:MAG: hypothetical protein ABH934_04585 [Chloroflexota bacterium]
MWQRFLNKTFRSFPKETHTQTRWGIFQLFISFAIFFIACWVALLSIYYSFNGSSIVGVYIVVVATVLLIFGIISMIYAFYLGGKYLTTGSQDPTASKEDIKKAVKLIRKEIRRVNDNKRRDDRNP